MPRAAPNDDDNLCCTICLELPPSMVVQCKKGHLMCAGCYTDHTSRTAPHSSCPTCRESLVGEPIRNLAAEQEIARRPVQCQYCGEVLTRGQLPAHEARCRPLVGVNGGARGQQDPSMLNFLVFKALERERGQWQRERDQMQNERTQWELERQQLVNRVEQLEEIPDPQDCREACRSSCGCGGR